MVKLAKIFGDKRIVGYAGNRNVGKTNNIVALIEDFRKYNKETKIYVFGFDNTTYAYLKKLGNILAINSLDQLVNKKDSLFIIDEMQKLHLSDKRYKDLINDFINMIYHPENNNKLILCSPNLREFNSVIGSKIEVWVVKSIRFSDLINGSPLKNAVSNYQGVYKQLNDIIMPFDKLLVLNADVELVIDLKYVKKVDTKKGIKDIFWSDKKSQTKSQTKIKEGN